MPANNQPEVAKQHFPDVVISDVFGGRIQLRRRAFREIVDDLGSLPPSAPNGGGSATERVSRPTSDFVQPLAHGPTQIRNVSNCARYFFAQM